MNIWMLVHLCGLFHYIYYMQNTVANLPSLNLPDVCVASPVHGKAFCQEHCELLECQQPPIPTGLREFLKHCGTLSDGNFKPVYYYIGISI